jgi:RNA polymerase sigma factor for flagellar operon FliA
LDRQRLLLLHLPQVRLVAKGIWDRMRFAVELDDLIGYGTIGLLHAVERFDPGRGIMLKTYAEHRIRGAILDGLRGMDWLPRSARQKERQQKEQERQESIRGVSAFSATSGTQGWPSGAVNSLSIRGTPPPFMHSVVPGGNLGDLEKLTDASAALNASERAEQDPERLYERKEKYDQLSAAIARLPRRHRQILDLYYRREMSMRQIGAVLRVHESRISQLHAAAVARLRRDLSGSGSPSDPTRKPPQRYLPELPEAPSSNRHTAIQSCSVSTPMVS